MAKRKMRNADILTQIKNTAVMLEDYRKQPDTMSRQINLAYLQGKLEAFKAVYGQDGL